ncbi:hypothetical protein NXS98_14050 [Fontisphaera persica]|uniref:Pam3-gp28 family putative phage holin n=1 Tax=Fontisphaera persica TaxID=2974023 RepID=UPI0024BF85E1|nr:hypothetical protein [Fontisphaera persica]WCJ58830.1 hypothetical protein NXS98_14050 [Fontisphaera persica]
MNQDILAGLARHLLTALGGMLVARGWTDTARLEAAVGALITLAGFAWSVWHKRRAPARPSLPAHD